MAEDDRNIYTPSDDNRDGHHDDVDRRPGNSRVSAAFAQTYDPGSEQEYSNQPSAQELLRMQREQQQQVRAAMHAAQSDVHFLTGADVGKFIIPAENTWAAHAELVKNKELGLEFNTEKHFFDKVIAEKLRLPALTDKNHADYAKYEGLRHNLAVLRNDIIGMYLDDGGFDKGDEFYIPIMKGIAEVLGDSLSNDVWWKRPFTKFFSRDVANVEAVGAAEMYKFLLQEQDKPSLTKYIVGGMRELLGMPTKHWGLLSLEQSPFSPQALAAPAPDIARMVQSPQATPTQNTISPDADRLAMESLALINTANTQSSSVTNLSETDKAISVDDGRTILRWLRNLQATDRDVQDFIGTGTPPEQMAKAEALSKLVKLYAHQMHKSPHLHDNATVKDGSDAAGAVAMMLAEHAMMQAPENSPAHALLASAVDSMPEAHYERSTQSVSRLLEHMEAGLATLSGQPRDERKPIDRLLAASERLHYHAQELRTPETLAAPTREESVELGREILRKLRKLMAADKPMDELVETGNPEEKATLAEKLTEMVEAYKNILTNALIANPGLADDARVKEANDAIGGMTHGIKLMATKEIPNNAAQTQQIGADVTKDPAEWSQLHGRTAKRLMDSIEGGMAAAAEGMQEQDQQKAEEQAQEINDANLAQAANARGKRRRRRAQKSGLGGKSSEKKMRDIMADDMAAGQGVHAAKTTEKASPYVGLGEKDLAAIKGLGKALSGASKEAKNLPMANVTAGDVISADGKSAADRAIERAKQSRNRNNSQAV